MFFFSLYVDQRDLHVLTHSVPTRRSSDLHVEFVIGAERAIHVHLVVDRLDEFPHRARRGAGRTGRPVKALADRPANSQGRSEEHTSELQSLMRISYAVFCLKKKIIILKCETKHYL